MPEVHRQETAKPGIQLRGLGARKLLGFWILTVASFGCYGFGGWVSRC